MGLLPKRHNTAPVPAPIDPVRQRPYSTEADELASEQLAAGQLALATLETAEQRRARLRAEVEKYGNPFEAR